MTRDPLAPMRALPPAAAWLASRGPLRAPWLRHAHAVARRAVVADVRARTRRAAVHPARP